MKHRLLSAAVAGLSVAATLVVAQAPAAAGPGGPKNKDLRENGCRDIIFGAESYTRDRTVDSDLFPDEGYPDEFQGDAGTARLDLELSAPSCPEVTYTLTVYGSDQSVLVTKSIPGDGTTGTKSAPLVLSERVEGYAQDCLMLVATTRVQGIVVDTAPDVIPAYDDVCDGESPGLTYK